MAQIKQLATRGYLLLIRAGELLQPFFLLAMRLTWGYDFYFYGKGKLVEHQNFVEVLTGLNIPFPEFNAWFVAGVETFGGIFLMLGLLSRPWALALTINMIVAYFSVESDRNTILNYFEDYNPFFAATPFFNLQIAVIVLAFGPGFFSLDALLKKKFWSEKA